LLICKLLYIFWCRNGRSFRSLFCKHVISMKWWSLKLKEKWYSKVHIGTLQERLHDRDISDQTILIYIRIFKQ
jgi:hypothetical protein